MTASVSFLAPGPAASSRSSRDALRVLRRVAFGFLDPTLGPRTGGFVPQEMADFVSATGKNATAFSNAARQYLA